MSVRARLINHVMLSSSANEEKDFGNHKSEVYTDVFEAHSPILRVLDVSEEDVLLPSSALGDIRIIFLKTSADDSTQLPADIELKLNSAGADPIVISPIGPKTTSLKEGWLIMTCSGVTSVYVSNTSSTVKMKVSGFFTGNAA